MKQRDFHKFDRRLLTKEEKDGVRVAMIRLSETEFWRFLEVCEAKKIILPLSPKARNTFDGFFAHDGIVAMQDITTNHNKPWLLRLAGNKDGKEKLEALAEAL